MPTTQTPAGLFAVTVLLATLAGCSTTYDTRYEFQPRPAETLLQVPGTSTPAARALVSVIGIRRASSGAGTPASVELRFRIDNVGGTAVTFDPATMILLSADLQQFPRARTDPSGAITVGPNTSLDLIAWFPFPGDPTRPPMDLNSLSLQWTLEVAGRPVPGSVTVKRRQYTQSGYWPSWWHFGYSHGFHRRGHGHGRGHFGFGYRGHR